LIAAFDLPPRHPLTQRCRDQPKSRNDHHRSFGLFLHFTLLAA
jgi:hypothetical protein